ncbi:hypothetical protein VIGAN_06088900 [Vigna angularis var. angularis]|uniref:Acylamino-acid-releasing enzyme N-terminal domain-containing protein n=1 Tax=Vigna angularis var. angularis TaxID=157739 RepID=A0A0S3SAB1_PHAAN|nr:hypothetical protein VIGAN_06088900 [Vigna angularis var. angularis]
MIPVVMCAEDGCFPGLYCTIIHSNPWLSDNCTMIISSIWHSSEVLLSVNVLSGEIVHISPVDPNFSWNLLTLDGNNIVASKNNCSICQYLGLLKWRNMFYRFSLLILLQFPVVRLILLK